MKPETIMQKNAQQAANLLKSLANLNRLIILCQLAKQDQCVTDLLSYVDISQTALSQHLAKLRVEGIIDYRRDHRHLYYFIKNKNVKKIIRALYDIYCA